MPARVRSVPRGFGLPEAPRHPGTQASGRYPYQYVPGNAGVPWPRVIVSAEHTARRTG